MYKSKQIASNMIMQSVSFAVSMLVSFFLTPFIVEKIGKEIYGFVGLAGNVTECITVLTAAINGIANRYITVSYIKGDIKSANAYFTSVTLSNVLVVAFFIVPGALLLLFLDKFINIPSGHVLDVKILWGFIFAMLMTDLIFGRMQVATFAGNRLDLNGKKEMIASILKVVTLVLMYCLSEPYVCYIGISAYICLLYSVFTDMRYFKLLTPELKYDFTLFSPSLIFNMLKVGIWNSVNQLSQLLFTGLDLFIANIFIGAAGMSLLSVAKTLPIQIIVLIGIIAGAFYPQMTAIYAKEPSRLPSDTSLFCRICGLICSVPIIGFIVFGASFFRLWLPSLSTAEISELQFLSVLTLLPQLISIYVFPLYQINTLTCKLKIPAIINLIAGLLNVALVFVLLKTTLLGLYAIAGVSSLLLILRIAVFLPLYAAKCLNTTPLTFYPPLIRGLLQNLTAFLGFYLIERLIAPSTWLMLILSAALCAALGYFSGTFILLSSSERKKLFFELNNRLFSKKEQI